MTAPHGRARSVSPEAHRVYRALIDHRLITGSLPPAGALATATGLDRVRADDALAELVATDWAGRDEDGTLASLYLFSPAPTDIRVRVGAVERFAMCAIDALGVAPMLGRAVEIATACLGCGAPLGLAVAPGSIEAVEPPTAAALHRRTPGPAYLTRCRVTRFVCSPPTGRRGWPNTAHRTTRSCCSPRRSAGRARCSATTTRTGGRAAADHPCHRSLDQGGEG